MNLETLQPEELRQIARLYDLMACHVRQMAHIQERASNGEPINVAQQLHDELSILIERQKKLINCVSQATI